MMSLALTPGREFSVDADFKGPGLALQQALGGENMFDFGCSDAEGEGAKGAVR